MAWARFRDWSGPRRVRGNLRVSPNEERYLLAESMTNQVYNAPTAVRLIGPLDLDRLEAAIRATCDRHEAHRTGYELGADGRFTKYVEDRARVVLKRASMPGASDDELREAVRAYFFTKTSYAPENLHRFLVIQVAEDEHVYAYGLHHVTADGTSFRKFALEVEERRRGRAIPDEPVAQYSDYWDFDWENSEAYRAAEAFWTERLSGLGEIGACPPDRSAGEFDRQRPSVSLMASPQMVAATKAAAARIGVTHFTFLYAVYAVFLSRMTGSDMVCTTFQSAGRRTIGASDLVQGVFSNALLLATKVDETDSIAALATRLKGEVREAVAHEIFPYHHVSRKTGLRGRYAINWFPYVPEVAYDDVEVRRLDMKDNQDDDDLNVRFTHVGEEIQLHIFYKASAFGAARVQAMARTLLALAEALAQDVDRPIGAVRTVDLEGPGVLPDPAEPLPSGGAELIHTRFLQVAADRPEATAILHGERRIAYGELERRSRTFAQVLRRQGVAAGDRVAILADRGPELVWSMLAAARLGAVFVVLDAADPDARLSDLLDLSAPKALVHTGGAEVKAVARRLAATRAGLALADAAAATEDAEDAEGLDAARPEAPAYFLFTSGSTGRPKCVAASHQPLTHFVRWQAETFGLGAGDRFAMLSGLSHDPLLRDIFTPLSLGATLLIPDQATVLEPGALAPWLRQTRASVVHITPPLGQILAAGASRAGDLPELRRVFWGGDELRPALAAEIAALAPGAEQVNFYGATETPQAASYFRLDGDPTWRSIPVGFGSDGFQLLIVDKDRRPLGVGEVGEIAVRSNYLSLGYVEAGRVAPPQDRGLDPAGQANIYYTGDRGFRLPDGAVVFTGRADDQLKIRGHRVDLSEVTSALLACPGVRSGVALAVGEGAGLRIEAFVVPKRAPAVGEAELRTLLAARLPGYMVPHDVRIVQRLPLLPNGKLDRQALLALGDSEPPPPRTHTFHNPTERALVEAWSSIFGHRAISREESFASLGGDSLSYVQAYLATEEVIGEAPVGWHFMSIADLAAAQTKGDPLWSVVDTPIVFRAVSILLVVAGHFSLLRYGGGATSMLMVISGFMFGKLALNQAFKQESAQPVLRGLWSLFLPTAILSLIIYVARLPGTPPESFILTFTADFQDYTKLIPEGRGNDIYLWYVHGLLHMMLLIYLALLALKALKGFGIGQQRFLLILFGVACLGRFVLPGFLDPQFFSGRIDHFAMVNYLPTTRLPTLLLGALIAGAVTRREKVWMALLTLAYAALTLPFFGHGRAQMILAGGAVLLTLPRVRIPRIVSPVVFGLAGASLWIYLSHMVTWDALAALGLPRTSIVTMALAVGVGVIAWGLWSWGIGVVNRALKRPLGIQADAAV